MAWYDVADAVNFRATDGPLLVLGAGLLLTGWVLRGGRHSEGWQRLMGAAVALTGAVVVGAQLLQSVWRADVPDLTRCLALLRAQGDEQPASVHDIARQGSIGFVSGAVWGVYWEMGEDLARAAKGMVDITNIRTRGTQQNCDLMRGPTNAALGVLQGDTLLTGDLKDGSQANCSGLGAIMQMHPETVQVLTRSDVLQPGREGLEGWKGRRVLVPDSSEGSRATARYLLGGRAGFPAAVKAVPAEYGLCQVVTGQADAMVVVAGKPTPLFARLQRLAAAWPAAAARLRFAPIKLDAVGSHNGARPTYETAEIDRRDYPWLNQLDAVPTISTRAVLAGFDFGRAGKGYDAAKCRQITELVCVLRREHTRLRQPPNHPMWRQVKDMADPLPGGWTAHSCLPLPGQC